MDSWHSTIMLLLILILIGGCEQSPVQSFELEQPSGVDNNLAERPADRGPVSTYDDDARDIMWHVGDTVALNATSLETTARERELWLISMPRVGSEIIESVGNPEGGGEQRSVAVRVDARVERKLGTDTEIDTVSFWVFDPRRTTYTCPSGRVYRGTVDAPPQSMLGMLRFDSLLVVARGTDAGNLVAVDVQRIHEGHVLLQSGERISIDEVESWGRR